MTKYLRLTVDFMRSSALRGKFIVCFFRVFARMTKFSVLQIDWELGYHSFGFKNSPDIS